MAVTVSQLANALRLTVAAVDTETTELLERFLSVAQDQVEDYAPDAPDTTKDEAIIRISGFLYDVPPGGRTDPLRRSGAATLLLPWREHRVGIIE